MIVVLKLLLTGYEPFDGFTVNPSQELVKSLGNKTLGNFAIHGKVLPLDYKRAFADLEPAIDGLVPDVILCCGQSNRGSITIERIGLNALNPLKEDNYGNLPESDIIVEGAPAGYFSTIDAGPLVALLKTKGIPAQVSYHAGTFGCNWILFLVLHKIANEGLSSRATFVHFPPLPEQAIEKNRSDLPNMPLRDQLRALETIIGAI